MNSSIRMPAWEDQQARTGAQGEPFVFKQDVISSDFRAHCFITNHYFSPHPSEMTRELQTHHVSLHFQSTESSEEMAAATMEASREGVNPGCPEGLGWPPQAPAHRPREGRNRTQGPPPAPTSMKPNTHTVTGHLLIISHFSEESLFLLLLDSSKYLRLPMHFLKRWICTSLKEKSEIIKN